MKEHGGKKGGGPLHSSSPWVLSGGFIIDFMTKLLGLALHRLRDKKGARRSTRSLPFLLLLAEEGVKLEVGGEGERGGLLVEDPTEPDDSLNVLQLLSYLTDYDSPVGG